ncbi:MAG: TIGR04255 family protein [Gammaproteobacteria bacterium]
MVDHAERDLPDFHNPPVVETVLSVQFEKLLAMQSVHFGLFWQRVRERFPSTQDHPALAPVLEQPPGSLSQALQLRFEAQEVLPLQRIWLLNGAGTEMIQIQNDRFIKNWRKSDQEYPHYEPVIKPAFERDFLEFQSFLTAERLGEPRPNQCEVTYVNHIVAGEGWSRWDEFDKVFTFWTQPAATPYPGRAEDFAFRARFPIIGPNNAWIGRLHVEVQAAVRLPDKQPIYAMNLTARGMYGEGIDFFDIGRRWIVKSFEHLTTEHMHQVWGKKN